VCDVQARGNTAATGTVTLERNGMTLVIKHVRLASCRELPAEEIRG